MDQVNGMDELYTDSQYGNDFGYSSTGCVLGKSDGKTAQDFAHYATYPVALSPDFGRALRRIVGKLRPSPAKAQGTLLMRRKAYERFAVDSVALGDMDLEAGVALTALGWLWLGDICFRFVWQTWHLATWTLTLCGRRGTYGAGLALVTALVAVGPVWPRAFFTLCGRRGTYGTGLAVVTGVALGDMDLDFVWQAWHLRHWAGSGDGLCRRWSRVAPRLFCVAWRLAWHLATWTLTLCGRRGTYGIGLAVVTALVAVGPVSRRASFAWQAWHLVTSAFVLCVALTALGSCGAAPLLRGRCGTWRGTSDMDLHFVWQVWHLWHWAGCGDGLGRRWSRVAPRIFCVAGVALGVALATWTFTLCGRCGTYGTGLGLVTALVAAGPVWRRFTFAWQVWHVATSAGVALGDMDLHLVTSAFVLCGRRGWHLVMSAFVLCGRPGTCWHLPSFRVAGMALTALGRQWFHTQHLHNAQGTLLMQRKAYERFAVDSATLQARKLLVEFLRISSSQIAVLPGTLVDVSPRG
eukprot:s964_g3.t1